MPFAVSLLRRCYVALLLAAFFIVEPSRGGAAESTVEDVKLPWGGALRIAWPEGSTLVRIPSESSTEVRWENSAEAWTIALSLLAPAESGFSATAVRENTRALMVANGLEKIQARDDTSTGTSIPVLVFPARRDQLRELWFCGTDNGVIGVSVTSASGTPQAGHPAARAVVQALDAEKRPILTSARMLEDLRQLASAARSAWAWRDLREDKFGVDLEATERRLSARMTEQTSPAEFGLLLQEFVAAMQDGHASVRTNLVPQPLLKLPFTCRETPDGIIVSDVWDGTTGIVRGDRVLAVDGGEVEARLRESMRHISASTEHARRYYAVRKLTDAATPGQIVKIERTDGSRAAVRVTPSASPRSHADEISYRMVANSVGYLRLASFAQDMAAWEKGGSTAESLRTSLEPKFEKLREAFAALQNCSALVLDLRDNGDGSDLLGQFLARAFAPAGALYYSLEAHVSPELLRLPEFAAAQSRLGEGQARAAIVLEKFERPPTLFSGRLYILVDEGCFSATDCFLNFIACTRPDAVFVGTPNGAGAGAPREIVKLAHSGARFTCCVMRVWNPHGFAIEGNALAPTLPVRPSRADIAAGRDAVLAAALDHYAGSPQPSAGR